MQKTHNEKKYKNLITNTLTINRRKIISFFFKSIANKINIINFDIRKTNKQKY